MRSRRTASAEPGPSDELSGERQSGRGRDHGHEWFREYGGRRGGCHDGISWTRTWTWTWTCEENEKHEKHENENGEWALYSLRRKKMDIGETCRNDSTTTGSYYSTTWDSVLEYRKES
jgi:hypothetical protein